MLQLVAHGALGVDLPCRLAARVCGTGGLRDAAPLPEPLLEPRQRRGNAAGGERLLADPEVHAPAVVAAAAERARPHGGLEARAGAGAVEAVLLGADAAGRRLQRDLAVHDGLEAGRAALRGTVPVGGLVRPLRRMAEVPCVRAEGRRGRRCGAVHLLHGVGLALAPLELALPGPAAGGRRGVDEAGEHQGDQQQRPR